MVFALDRIQRHFNSHFQRYIIIIISIGIVQKLVAYSPPYLQFFLKALPYHLYATHSLDFHILCSMCISRRWSWFSTEKKTSTNYFNLNASSAFLVWISIAARTKIHWNRPSGHQERKRNFYLTNKYNKLQNMRFRFVDLLYHSVSHTIRRHQVSDYFSTHQHTHTYTITFSVIVSRRPKPSNYECIARHEKEFFNGRLKMGELNSVANGWLRFLIEKFHYFSEYFFGVWAFSVELRQRTNKYRFLFDEPTNLISDKSGFVLFVFHAFIWINLWLWERSYVSTLFI